MSETEILDKTFRYLYDNQNVAVHIANLTTHVGNIEGVEIYRHIEALHELGFARSKKNDQASMGANRIIYDYWISTPGIEFIQDLPNEFKYKPYSFYKQVKESDKNLSLEKVNLEVDKLRNDFFDYPETKKRTSRLEIWTIISVILAALAILISLFKK